MQIDANRICVPQRLRIKSRSCFDTHNSCFTLVAKFLDIMILIFCLYLTYAAGSNFVASVECFQTQTDTPATTRSHRDWQTLPPVVTTRCLAIHLGSEDIFDVSPESRAEFDCFQPRLKFWLKIRSCHSCRCCSLTFEPIPRIPDFSQPFPLPEMKHRTCLEFAFRLITCDKINKCGLVGPPRNCITCDEA